MDDGFAKMFFVPTLIYLLKYWYMFSRITVNNFLNTKEYFNL